MRFRRAKLWKFTFLTMISLWTCFIVRHKLKSSKETSKKVLYHNSECKILDLKSYHGHSLPKKPTTYSRKADHFPESRLHVDTTNDERKCPKLYEIARAMLDGEKIKLPYETNHTRWKFRERVDLNVLTKTYFHWNHPWQQGDSAETRRKLQRYNVSARTIPARKYLVTYGQNCCEMSKKRAVNQGIDVGKVDYAEALDLSHLSLPFQISHQNLLRHRKGAGYWLWKSYIILKTLLTKLNDGDLLLYHDSGSYFVKDMGPLFKICMEAKPSVLTIHQPYEESMYSKRDAFILMGMDEPRVYQKKQTQRLSGLMVYMKSCSTIQFAMEYLAYSADRRIVSDDKNVMGKSNFEGFIGNRHDQTVLSLLSKKWGIIEVRDPCTCGRNKFTQDYKYASGPYSSMYVNDRVRY
ncbi:Hypothetical predicted protein [Paramuricea clavata]|uniref:Uncharacterized protein n=1 Tax=Paramuricea clavata TaxID=317549 RepID=A0A7D9JCH7_PARCT|nr:Hypothetical predicted protein [Paramuricea clavata]